jgi:hypothetical protein
VFKIDFFVEDKQLPAVLHSINGKVLNLQVTPVVNAVVVKDNRGRPNGKLKQDAAHTMGLFCKELKKLGEITAMNAKDVLEKIGMSRTSYNHFLNEAVKAGLIKKAKKDGKISWSWV